MRKAFMIVSVTASMALVLVSCSSKSKPPPKPAEAQPAPTNVQPAAPTSDATMNCTKGADQRSLSIEAQDAGCELMYTKNGEAKSIATSTHNKKHCEDVMNKIEKHLQDAGYTCQ